MPSHLNHNDITLGFPLALETNTNSIVEALHQLMTEDSIGDYPRNHMRSTYFPILD